MGQNTTSFNIDELITSYIDNQISDPALHKQVGDMITNDAGLYKKYRSELLTKNLLQQRLKQVEVPLYVSQNITSSINSIIEKREIALTPGYSDTDYNKNYWKSIAETITAPFNIGIIPVPRFAFIIVFFVFIASAYFMFYNKGSNIKNPHVLAGTENSIMVQAVNEFHKLMDGECSIQYKSNNETEVAKYVQQNANFKAFVPRIENYDLSGCMLNDYKGRKLAHLVYVCGDDIIYIYQTTMDAIAKNELDLPGEVRDEIVKAKYYMCDGVDDNNCTMTLWFKDNIVCASMTTMPKQKMYNAFTSFIK